MEDVRLRPAAAEDAARLAALAKAAYGHYVARLGGPPRPMTDDYAALVASGEVTVAERGGEVVGLAVLTTGDEGFTLDNLAVDPPHQGTGVGRALLEHAEAEARRAGHGAVHLYTHERMSENQALYARIGYEEYARRDIGAGCLVYMRKPLGAGE